MQKISPELLLSLKEALALVYWRKNDTKFFIANCISHPQIVNSIDWDQQTKFVSCSQLVDYMSRHQNEYSEDLFSLISHVSAMTDFSHLSKWDNGPDLIKKAQQSVFHLRQLAQQHSGDFSNQLKIEEKRKKAQERIQKTQDYHRKLDDYKKNLSEITKLSPQKRGYALEKFLCDLFLFFDLAPRGAFKIKGEQIDGAFTHDGTDYLLEAKWHSTPIANEDLFAFSGKIDNKLKNTLGLFISMSGFSAESIASNPSTNKAMILIDGQDLMMVLDDHLSLPELIRLKRRHASETGEIFYHIPY